MRKPTKYYSIYFLNEYNIHEDEDIDQKTVDEMFDLSKDMLDHEHGHAIINRLFGIQSMICLYFYTNHRLFYSGFSKSSCVKNDFLMIIQVLIHFLYDLITYTIHRIQELSFKAWIYDMKMLIRGIPLDLLYQLQFSGKDRISQNGNINIDIMVNEALQSLRERCPFFDECELIYYEL